MFIFVLLELCSLLIILFTLLLHFSNNYFRNAEFICFEVKKNQKIKKLFFKYSLSIVLFSYFFRLLTCWFMKITLLILLNYLILFALKLLKLKIGAIA